MKTKIVQKIGSLVLALVMAFSIGSPAFAAENSDANTVEVNGEQSGVSYSIKKIDDTSVLVESNGISELITVVENDNTRAVTIQNTKTGKKNYLRYDKSTNTIYSSITGKTVHLNSSDSNAGISTRLTSSYSYQYISYAKLKSAIGETTTVGNVVAAILAFIPGATVASGAVTGIDAVLNVINYNLPDESNHGLRLTVRTEYYYRTRFGHRAIYRIDHTITAVNRY